MLRRSLFGLLAFMAMFFCLVPFDGAEAQGTQPGTFDEVCSENPDAEECICRKVARIVNVTVPDESDPGDATLSASDYNPNYARDCALEYFKEDLRRVWISIAAIAGALAAGTIAWSGVGYMQDAASGQDFARTRNAISRAIVGVIILGGTYVILNNIGLQLFGVKEYWWDTNTCLFYGVGGCAFG